MAKKKTIKGTVSTDWLFGTVKNDMMEGLKGDDSISSLLGSDKLYGDEGDDTLYGGDGNDSLSGDDDNDYLDGGLGNDKLFGGEGDDNLSGGKGNDNLSGGEDNDSLYGWEGNDKLSGDAGDDYLSGDEGNDRLIGGAGRDQLYGGSDNDRLDGGEGHDRLDGGGGSDNLVGGNGNDYLTGGNDAVRDVLSGGAGRDRVVLQKEDTALGGKDEDTLVITVYDYLATDSVTYTLDLSKITGKGAANIGHQNMKAGQFENAEVIIDGAGDGSLFIGSKGDDSFNIWGSSGTVKGGAGNDRISVSSYGSETNPDLRYSIDGGAGNDRITSYGGNMITGGAGSDIFVMNWDATPGARVNTIMDFTSKDRLLLDYLSSTITMNKANPLVAGSDPVANSTMAQFLYDTDDGRLFIDLDGTGARAAIQVFTLANKAALTASSFIFDF
ncbi:calcium-binding protein [Microvirga subterranea]|uniref:Hemolysin type calcium-binding protein n=1 Tax=Microvirga subterranea TaxID=186651 RepID=A0A370HPG7_9HYPH|nr:calcium-binding protein [Microvirga subterranea]RDI60135.1 hemolysin type calcium-binding protein [Microvirga subterranea]